MAVYLIHFSEPISPRHTTRHYIGYAVDVQKRLEAHQSGTGSRLCQIANQRGIAYSVVRVWPDGDRRFERHLKNKKNAKRLCPICQKWHAVQAEMRLEPDGDDIWPDAPAVLEPDWEQIETEKRWRAARTMRYIEWDCEEIPW